MKVKFYGTRGSIPVSGPDKVEYGGNTTSIQVISECLPKGWALAVDSGSGFVPFAYDCLKNGIKNIIILYTHYHHDHTMGLTLAPVAFIKSIRLQAYGPEELGIGPSKMMENLFRPPYFPVDFREIKSHIHCKGIDFPNSRVFVIHAKGGLKYFTIDQFEQFETEGKMIPFDRGEKYSLEECLIVKMHKSNHPERTISYRFEERTSGAVFVFLTDHENQDGKPNRFMQHVNGANLLVMDSQYDRKRYDTMTAGYGHGTPDYCVETALQAKASVLGLTHHDPNSSDAKIGEIVAEAEKALAGMDQSDSHLKIFACKDYQETEV